MQYATEYIGSNYGEFASDYKVLVDANVKCAQTFGLDQLSCISDPYRETCGFGSQIEYMKDGPPRSTHPLYQKKDLSKLLKPDPHKSDRMQDRINAANSYFEKFNKQYSIMGWVEGPVAETADLRGISEFMMDMVDNESYACDLMDLCLQVAIDFAREQVKAGCDTIGIGDAIASLVSSQMYESLIQPREKILIKTIQDMGAYVRLHICGNIAHLLPGINDLGVDILDVDHMVDMKNVREIIGYKVALAGNLDPVQDVLFGSPTGIKQKFQEIYNNVGCFGSESIKTPNLDRMAAEGMKMSSFYS